MTKKLQNLEKRGLKRRAEAAVEGAGTPSLLEGAANAYAALPDPHHRSYGKPCSPRAAVEDASCHIRNTLTAPHCSIWMPSRRCLDTLPNMRRWKWSLLACYLVLPGTLCSGNPSYGGDALCAGALLHAAEAAHNNEPQHVLQHAAQDGAVQAAPALGPPPPQAPLDMMGALQQLLHGQQVRHTPQHLHVPYGSSFAASAVRSLLRCEWEA